MLAALWVVLVPAWWLGAVVASMDAEASRRIAIDLDGYFLPRYVWASAMLARGVLPLWNPHELAGVPMLGVGQGAVLYPPRLLLFATLPAGAALHAFFVFHYLLLGAGSFAALRALGRAWPGAALGALVVTFQPFMLHGHYAPHWISNFAWSPLAVAAFVTLVERPGAGAAAALAAALSLQVYAGYPEYAFDTALALALLFPFVVLRARRAGSGAGPARAAAWLAAAAFATALATAVQWVPLVEAAGESVRAAGEYEFMFGMTFDREAFAAGPRGWVDALGLLFYVPPIGWILLGVGLATRETRHRAAMVALALLAWAAPTWLRDVPPFSLFRGPLCWHSMLHLPLAALAGAGLDHLLARGTARAEDARPRARWGVVAIVAVALLPLVSMRAALWTGLGLLGLALAARRARPAGVALVLTAALGAIWTWVPAAKAPLVHRWAAGQPTYPDLAARRAEGEAIRAACGPFAEGRVLAPRETWLGAALLAGLRTAQGYPESLAPRRTSALLDAAGLGPHDVLLDRARMVAAGRLLALLDVRCLVLPADWALEAERLGYRPAGTLRDGRIVRVRDGHAALLVDAVERVPSDEVALARVTAPDFEPRTRALVVGGGEPAAVGVGYGRVEDVRRPSPGTIAVRVEAPDGGYLVVAETWYPGWRATVNGAPAAVERADYAFLGVPLPRGAADVVLRYEPRGFAAATWATIVGVLLVAGGAVAGVREGRSS